MRISRSFLTNPEFLFRQQAFRFVWRDLEQPWRSWVWRLKQKANRVMAGLLEKLRAALGARRTLKPGVPPRDAGTPPPVDRSPSRVRQSHLWD